MKANLTPPPKVTTADLMTTPGTHTYIVRQITAMQPGSRLNVWYQVVMPEHSGYYSPTTDTWFRLVDTGRVSQYDRRICRIDRICGREPVGPEARGHGNRPAARDGQLVEAKVCEGHPTYLDLYSYTGDSDRVYLLGDGDVVTDPLVHGYATGVANDGMTIWANSDRPTA